MHINEPTPQQIETLKLQHPDRTLYQVEAVDMEDTYFFVMTAPLEVEHKKYTDEIVACAGKNQAEQISTIRAVVRNAALAQIRHPEREEAKRILSSRPEMIEKFANELRKHAGSEVELRSKKL